MNNQVNIKDWVWFHNGEPELIKGRVVEIIDLAHLNEGYDPNQEFYVIEVETGIDNIYEVRTWGQISLTEQGPINCYIPLAEEIHMGKRYLKKIGIKMPNTASVVTKRRPRNRTANRKKSRDE